ncbi:hypothetical protein ATANTOWER_024649 [Ataeniobius toweri]|uniref:Uncharacterized protein n=1 Tax=Ataeniobius toweri TaxID=208326 RepID=A0ABU7AH04_9TELE|nr:hypothetical protein [Ataeniobius toweri]
MEMKLILLTGWILPMTLFCSPEATSSLERGRGRERGWSQPSGNGSCSSRSTGGQVPVDRNCHKVSHSSTGQIES